MGGNDGAGTAPKAPPAGQPVEPLDTLKELVSGPQDLQSSPADLTWAGVKRSSPDLYLVSLLVLVLGVMLMLSVPFAIALGTQLLVLPGHFGGLGGAIEMMSGLMLILVGQRLLRREHAAWVLAEFVLFFAVIATVLRGTVGSILLSALVLVIMVYLAMRRDLFVNPRRYRVTMQESIAFSALVLVIIYGVVGSLYISDIGGFDPPIEDTTDAMFYTVQVITTVGDSGFHAATPLAKWFSISLMLMGISTFLGAVGVVLMPYIERRVKGVLGLFQRMQETGLRDHVIVCGRSDESQQLVDFLEEVGQPFVVVSLDRPFIDGLRERGLFVVLGDPASEEILDRANIAQARSLVAVHQDDAENAFIVVTARGMRPDLFIIAIARTRETVPKLKKVGANDVVATETIISRYIGRVAIAGHGGGSPVC